MKYLYLLSFLILFTIKLQAQGGSTCAAIEPFCAECTGGLAFDNVSNGSTAESGINYDCLLTQPNPAWYYLEVADSGDLDFEISQVNTAGNGIDVDFICWGPFPDASDICGPANLNSGTQVDCSYSTAPIETFSITGAQAGEIYVLLITNYNGSAGSITLTQTNLGTGTSSGSTNCSMLEDDLTGETDPCEGDVVELTSSTANVVSFQWFYDDLNGTGSVAIPGATNANYTVPSNQSGAYTIEKTDCTGDVVTNHIEVNFHPMPVVPSNLSTIALCDEITPNDGYEEFDLTTMEDEILNGQTGMVLTYYTSFTDALNGFPANQISTPEAFTNTNIDSQDIYVRLESGASGCYNVGSFTIDVVSLPQAIAPTPYYGCDYDGTGVVTYYLNNKTDEILNGQTGVSIAYYGTEADMEAQTNALPNTYVSSVDTQTIYVRLDNPGTGCFNTTSFELINVDVPVMNTPTTLTFCDDDNDGFGEFYLEQTALDVVPADGNNYTVTFHVTETDAENDVNVFTSPFENIVPDAQTIYIRVENDLTGCYDVDPLELIVNPTPVVPFDLPDLELCDDQLVDGRAEFDLTEQNANVYGSQSTADFTISYYETEIEAVDGVNAISTSYYVNQVAFQQTIYVRLEDNTTGCATIRAFDLLVHPNPVINPSYDYDLALCDDFGQPGDGITVFDLTVKNDEITGGVNGYVVTYYETEADAEVGVNAIADDTAYENTVSPYTLHVRVEDANTGCYSLTTLTLRVLNNPSPQEVNPELEVCDDDSDGDSTNGQAEFDLTLNEEELLNGELGVTATYYETYQDAFDGTNAIPNPEAYYNTVQFAQTIYVAVTNDDTGCLTIVTIDINVNSLPEVTEEPTYFLCEVDNDDVETILLTDMDSFVLDGGDATGLEITYYETEANAIDDEEEYVNSTITINGTEQIYARVENTDTGCYSVVGFLIDIEQAPLAFTPDPIVYCESLGADGYYNNDGVEVFNLEEVIETIRGSQDPDTYPVAIYTSLADAENQENAIPVDELNPYTSGTATLYAVVTNANTGCTNGDPIVIELIVEPVPEVTLDNADGVICTDATNNPVIGTDLGAEYTYEWNTGETTPTIEITEAGEYYVTITNTTTINQCAYESNHVYYEEASLPAVTPTVVQSEIFDGQNTVQVTANGAGVSEYGYQLDNGTIQYNGTFNDVEPGVHNVTITELNGCGSLTLEVSVIDYMKYFTPNGDGVNDTWRVIGLESQENAQVFIFDRYGKMVKQMNATSDGWNGTFNGNQMPSSDYWFKVVYTEPSTGEVREFNSHFALKR
ncbi:T9SS type B sorting domain-containing protein [Neptunitalea lumnitzerae]|uniref:Gliding motility-associated C-terminal domain-containing protein n=1 Tax=Neptunitalea lumnitzerae TaxID=2965509 RepID=A0ABQ5MKI6_9FLAO|nr:T9SS type B sorting domain-containing protein [Neptunitalea sp. Y10]GLB49922.1 hypothetical protein Y10_22900 [Neptunitalea sp. Y10]